MKKLLKILLTILLIPFGFVGGVFVGICALIGYALCGIGYCLYLPFALPVYISQDIWRKPNE